MADQYSTSFGLAPQGISINDNRRMFNFGERVAELAPQESPFFTYLSKVSKKPTDDPVFKFMEKRHQWQRRNFKLKTALESANYTHGSAMNVLANQAVFSCEYDKYGVKQADQTCAPRFFLSGQIFAMKDTTGTLRYFKFYNATASSFAAQAVASGTDGTNGVTTVAEAAIICVSPDASNTAMAFAAGTECQIIGTQWGEGSTDPEGWVDFLYDRQGYCQIFKTAIPMFTGTSLATRYRGDANEYKRVWAEKLMEHKMDLEHAMLFSPGPNSATTDSTTRATWGILPYTMTYGTTQSFTYANTGYDDFIDFLSTFFAPESGNSGNKLVLASRNLLAWFNKLGSGNFLNNILPASSRQLDIQNIKGSFGHEVTKINTIFGNLHFVQEPLLRNGFEDYCIIVDLKNVAYRPLVGNGISRDTHIITNVQNNNVDGRKDIIITEAGLEIQLPETHAVLTWS